ncbi:multicopper oxidase [Daedalea quercina L-15889]|uniref:laccase n=1 Tax=Daedalea quercina L-15889 TaxID=1314783 RepID=A0A165QAS3_9APHY|nr:multicopper oxidase [Daedalea quercina L-15889]
MLSSSIFSSLAAALSLALAASADRGRPRTVTELNIVNKEVAPDGFPRVGVLPNGTFPGPIIKGYKGDTFQINVTNQLHDNSMNTSTTVHWHGIDQHHTNWADGVAFVTQCPIEPGHSFLYDFDVPDQAGTFWYHSHEGVQYCDGLRGPLVIYDEHDPHKNMYDVDDETTVITLSDWYHVPARNYAGPKIGPVAANSTLINSLGRMGQSHTPVTVIEVEQGKRYRFRLLSASCHPYFNFSIDGHDNLTIIEADGQNTEPLTGIDQIQMLAAQRYSVVLEANQPIGNYWIRAVPEQVNPTSFNTSLGLAILRYRGAPAEDPKDDPYTNAPVPKNPLLEQNLHAYRTEEPVPPLDPDCEECNLIFNFTLDVNANDPRDGLFLVNGTSYQSPTVPVLLQILSGKYTPQQLLPHGSIYALPRNKTIQVTMPGLVLGGPHPLHLHGHSFHVIRSAGSNSTNTINPVFRDTLAVGGAATDDVTIRFRTDNPGPWIMHCHIDFHLALGFAIVFAEDAPDVAADISPIPPAWYELCPIFDKGDGNVQQYYVGYSWRDLALFAGAALAVLFLLSKLLIGLKRRYKKIALPYYSPLSADELEANQKEVVFTYSDGATPASLSAEPLLNSANK